MKLVLTTTLDGRTTETTFEHKSVASAVEEVEKIRNRSITARQEHNRKAHGRMRFSATRSGVDGGAGGNWGATSGKPLQPWTEPSFDVFGQRLTAADFSNAKFSVTMAPTPPGEIRHLVVDTGPDEVPQSNPDLPDVL